MRFPSRAVFQFACASAIIATAGQAKIGVAVKWMLTALAVALAIAGALPLISPHGAAAQTPDPLIDPPQGAAGSRFQIVGQSGWQPGDAVTISFAFADVAPGAAYAGPFYNEQHVTVLRDGTWSFPTVVNDKLFPFPLWRPGYIVVRAQSASHTTMNAYLYTVEGRPPAGLPPLASFGTGSRGTSGASVLAVTLALFAAATGTLIAVSGAMRRPTPSEC
jgi:hypothetical protein